MKLHINGKEHLIADAAIAPDMPLLWVLRDVLNMTGTKFGCGIAACGACTVHLDGVATRSCVLPVAAVQGRAITTIEGLAGVTPPLAPHHQQPLNYMPCNKPGSTIRCPNAVIVKVACSWRRPVS